MTFTVHTNRALDIYLANSPTASSMGATDIELVTKYRSYYKGILTQRVSHKRHSLLLAADKIPYPYYEPAGVSETAKSTLSTPKLTAAAFVIAGILNASSPAAALPYMYSVPSIDQSVDVQQGDAEDDEAYSNAVNLAFAIKKIKGYYLFEDGWSGPSSVRPGSKTLVEAQKFVRSLFSENPVLPATISLSSDGQVNFFWNSDKILLDFGIKADGHQSYYARFANGEELIVDDLPAGTDLDQKIKNAIRM